MVTSVANIAAQLYSVTVIDYDFITQRIVFILQIGCRLAYAFLFLSHLRLQKRSVTALNIEICDTAHQSRYTQANCIDRKQAFGRRRVRLYR